MRKEDLKIERGEEGERERGNKRKKEDKRVRKKGVDYERLVRKKEGG